MAPRILIKDRSQEKRLFMNRTVIAVVGMVVLTGVLLGRLYDLQVVRYHHYSTLSQENRVRVLPVPPTRGLIYDRNGVVLAENRPSFRLVVTPEQVPNMDETLAQLGKLVELRPTDVERFRTLLKQKRQFDEIPLKFKLTQKEVAHLAVNRSRFPGVEVQASLSRHYPLGPIAVHVVGYVGRINEQELRRLDPANYSGTSHIGKTGVERFYETQLHGTAGIEKVETNASGRVIRTLDRTPPQSGEDLYLTIDSRLEALAEKALGDFSGSVIAIAPATGEILAMVSKPMFDPNLFVNGIDYDEYESLQKNHDQPLFNRALRGQYPPGSTVKPFIGLAGLDKGATTLDHETFCPGYFQLPNNDHKYRCWKRWGHGHVNLTEAITQSCDVYFYDLAYKLGIDNIHGFLTEFGFGRRTGIDLDGELPGLMPSRQWKRRVKDASWYDGETVITGIGQGFTLSTPLQLAYATATMANRGKRVPPHLLRATRDSATGDVTPYQEKPLPPIQLENPKNWELVINAMHQVVHSIHGTAHHIEKGLDFSVAGKTGTAQVYGLSQEDDEKYNPDEIAARLRDHALFIAFAPVDHPKIAVAVIVENGGGGSSVAAPIARKVLKAYLDGDYGDDG